MTPTTPRPAPVLPRCPHCGGNLLPMAHDAGLVWACLLCAREGRPC